MMPFVEPDKIVFYEVFELFGLPIVEQAFGKLSFGCKNVHQAGTRAEFGGKRRWQPPKRMIVADRVINGIQNRQNRPFREYRLQKIPVTSI